ncbi:MAG: sulfurtransferase complex subunit TusD [Nitrincola sp.]|nr:sulfurtransferase complex subunit TusD [Nitrincola sp.]
MIFTLIVHASPIQNQAPETALRFARSLLEAGHTLHRVFFYRDGVYNANALASGSADDVSIPFEWRSLAQEYQVDLVVCIAAAIRRGILDTNEARRYEKSQHNLAEGFELSGLGQLIEASILSDRVITFGGRG